MSGNGEHKRHRAMAGADAAAASPKRYAPLRSVTESATDEDPYETLECGHRQRQLEDLIGRTYAARRRCLKCLAETCAEAGHLLEITRGMTRSCRCGAADGAVAHLFGMHNPAGPTPLYRDMDLEDFRGHNLVTLGDVTALHDDLHAAGPPEREHYHWVGVTGYWSGRTRPQPPAADR